jgi:hypothetical protein
VSEDLWPSTVRARVIIGDEITVDYNLTGVLSVNCPRDSIEDALCCCCVEEPPTESLLWGSANVSHVKQGMTPDNPPIPRFHLPSSTPVSIAACASTSITSQSQLLATI